MVSPAKPKGTIAQLVEQRTENPCVPGSIPGGTTQKEAVTINVTAFFILYLIIKYAIMHYVYILQSQSTKDYYIGQTEDIEIRLAQHNTGFYTKAYTSNLKDWQLVHDIT